MIVLDYVTQNITSTALDSLKNFEIKVIEYLLTQPLSYGSSISDSYFDIRKQK